MHVSGNECYDFIRDLESDLKEPQTPEREEEVTEQVWLGLEYYFKHKRNSNNSDF